MKTDVDAEKPHSERMQWWHGITSRCPKFATEYTAISQRFLLLGNNLPFCDPILH